MRFSLNWLKKWVDPDLGAEALAGKLTASGLEAAAVKPVAADFSEVVVATILDCQPHPDADKLQVCSIDHGEAEPVQVVCGAPNARTGIKIPLAKVGAVIGGDGKIRKARLRGVESFGMACSARELGLSDDHSGLMELPQDAPLGMDLRDYLDLNDQAIELDLTPNRADCLSIQGVAQDVSASCRARLTALEIKPVEAAISDTIEVSLEQPEDCPRYVGRIIRNIDPTAPTPLWMVEALRRSGIRSISATVDATNYVLMELGQPMHAFDLDKLQGNISVRRGSVGESLELLDGKQVELDDSLLAICDEAGPVALAGIMGGLPSGVTDATKNILLESAYFKPATISGKARDLGLHTDASHRFERGVDPQGQVRAIERITALLLDISGGQAGPLVHALSETHLPAQNQLCLRHARLNRVLGIELDADEVTRILEDLRMQPDFKDGSWTITAPSDRFDIEIEEDLIEEVARIFGYDNIPATLPAGELEPGVVSEGRVSLQHMQQALCAAGYQEAINYSFTSHAQLGRFHMDEHVLPLANALSADLEVMRTALLPGLMETVSRNLRRQQNRVRFFETGTVFNQEDSLTESWHIAAVASGSAVPEQWGMDARKTDFFDLKGDLEAMLSLRGQTGELAGAAEFRTAELPWLHPGQAAMVAIDGIDIGWAGSVHPSILKQLDIKNPVLAFELDIDLLSKREIPNTKNISRFPSIRRDLALLVPEKISFSEIKRNVVDLSGDLLANLILFDLYSGVNVEKGYKSLAIGLILQNVSCTLTDEVVDSLVQNVVQGLEKRLDAQLRG
ncbi:MAG: phenylalanine--tRNA ligase subunit beta [Gammaproteobacteria bacterium]|nr:MAG: phenylalanine--tRNA ligase subunit beta [Gammaproteobacteria bacterium]